MAHKSTIISGYVAESSNAGFVIGERVYHNENLSPVLSDLTLINSLIMFRTNPRDYHAIGLAEKPKTPNSIPSRVMVGEIRDGRSIESKIAGDRTKEVRRSHTANMILDTTTNDLLQGPLRIVLNLTEKAVTITDEHGVRKTFFPLMEEKLLSSLGGNVIIVELVTLNNVYISYKHTGEENYLECLLSGAVKDGLGPGGKNGETADLYRFANMIYKRELEHVKKTEVMNSNSIKITRAILLNSLEISKNEGVYMESRKLHVSFDNILETKGVTYDRTIPLELKERVEEATVTCFIVDNKSTIGPRWVNMFGRPMELVSIRSTDKEDGLYLIDSDNPSGHMKHCSLEEMENFEYIYKDREQATSGLDLVTKAELFKEQEKFENELKRRKEVHELELRQKEEKHLQELEAKTILTDQKLKADNERLKQDLINQENAFRAKSKLEMKEARKKAKKERKVFKEKLRRENEERNNELLIQIKEQQIKEQQLRDKHKQELDMKTEEFNQKQRDREREERYTSMSYERKNSYEEHKYERDMTMENIKLGLGIVGAIGTGLLLYNKFTK